MAEFEGVNVTKYDAGTSDTTWIDQGLVKSGLKVWSDSYEFTGEAVADTVVVGVLPVGAVIHGVLLATDDLGATTTLDVGDITVPTRYKTAVDVSTAATSDNGVNVDGLHYAITDSAVDARVLLTVGASAATGTAKVSIYYTN